VEGLYHCISNDKRENNLMRMKEEKKPSETEKHRDLPETWSEVVEG
jgi:hypothetical protein